MPKKERTKETVKIDPLIDEFGNELPPQRTKITRIPASHITKQVSKERDSRVNNKS